MNEIPSELQQAIRERYELLRELGRGGMAVVYLARDRRLDREVAIKVLMPHLAAAMGPERFAREIEIAAHLSHPHIVAVLDSGNAAGQLYYVMPLIRGESLRNRLDRERQLPVDEALQLFGELAHALHYAHGHGVVHRDIKPENILLQDGHALIADFGVARTLGKPGAPRLTEAGVGVGTPAYMSPEQLSADSDVDARADQYALGIVLYEMLSGDQPFASSTPQGVLARKMKGELLSVATVRSSLSPELDTVLRRALAPNAADRFPDVLAFADAVRAAQAAPPPPGRPRVAIRDRIVAIGAPLVAIALAILLIPRLAAPRLDPSLVAVFPFRVTTPGATDWSESIPDLLATTLDGTPGMRVADPWSLWRALRPSRDAMARSPDPAEAATLARARGAARFVLGRARRDGPNIEVTVKVYRTAGRDSAEQTITETVSEDSLTSLASRLAVSIMSRLGDRPPGAGAPNVERYTTHSAEAMKAYLAARSALRRGMIDSADHAIDIALARDSSFAIALSEAVSVKSWVQWLKGVPYSGLRPLIARARAFEDSLSERNRIRLQLQDALIETDGPRAAELAARLIERDSTDFDAWSSLAYVRTEHGWQYGATAADALDATERAVRLDSTNASALTRRAWLAAQSADLRDMRRQLPRLRAADTLSALIMGSELGLELLLAPDSAVERLVGRAAASPPPVWVTAYRMVRSTRIDRGRLMANTLLLKATPGFAARLARVVVATHTLGAGNLDSLVTLVDGPEFTTFDVERRRFAAELVASALAGFSTESTTSHALEALARYSPIDSAVGLADTREVWRAGWLQAAYHASTGDTALARRWYRVIGALPTKGAHPAEYTKSQQADLDARLAARRGDLKGALAHASRALRLWTIHTENSFEFDPEPQMRFLVARLLRAQNLPDSAAKLFRSLTPPVTWFPVLTPLAWTELGEIAEERRDCAHAAALYEAALSSWEPNARAAVKFRERAVAGRARCGVRGS